ncbi:MAG: Na+-dependent transporter [Xanthobacteraceae bacterium]
MPAALLKLATLLVQALAWLGRQGTRALAILVFIGIAVPPLGTMLKPYVTAAIFVLLCISFMRVDPAALRNHLRQPAVLLAATAWTAIGVPLLIGVLALAFGIDKQAPDLFLGLMLQAVASPIMAAPAFAALMGLDATLVLLTLVTSTALLPLTAPAFAYLFFGAELMLSPFALGLKLFVILAGALLAAIAIRRIAGPDAIKRQREPIDGVNILLMQVFVSAVMATLASDFFAHPLLVGAILLLAFAMFFAMLGLTMLIFRKLGRQRALALALAVAQRNMGLMLAATAGVLPAAAWLYFALCQFPMYIMPHLLRPWARAKAA